MRQERQGAAGEGRQPRPWRGQIGVQWRNTIATVLVGLVLSGAAIVLAGTLGDRATGARSGSASDRGYAATGTPRSSAAPTAQSTPDALSRPTEVGYLAAESPATDLTPTARAEQDDLRTSERPALASRGGRRPEEPTPAPTAQPTPTPRRQIITYKVAEGDTIPSLAERFGVSVQTIVKANDLKDPEHLSPGQELVILPISGVRHVVQEGDSVVAIAERYGVIPEEIVAVNSLAESNRLQLGQELLIPEISPDKLAAAVAPEAGGKPVKPATHVVAQGDTLSGIAARFGLTVDTLRWANSGLAGPDQLAVGQRLVIPPVDGMLHPVQTGDTVSGIAALYGASASDLVEANGLTDPYLLSVGQLVVVPGGRPVSGGTLASQLIARPTATLSPPKPASGAGSGIVGVAMRYRGYRYAWGGNSPQTGFDCSGLVWYVYRQAGAPVPRDLWGQYNSGPRISRDALQPGDIVFFKNTYQAGLSHDGIYVGGGQFIHAASESTGVIVSSLGESYWGARYLGATRPY